MSESARTATTRDHKEKTTMRGQMRETCRTVIRSSGWLSAAIVLISTLAMPVLAESAPVINGAYVDWTTGTITIEGTGFGTGSPVVTLGGSPLTVQSSSSTLIVASIPAGLPEGSSLLTVQQAAGTTKARFEVTADREATPFWASSTGGGPNPSSITQFFGATVAVTITSPTQRVAVTSFNAFGTLGASAGALNLFVCYRQLPSGAITTIGNGIIGLQLPASTKATFGVTKVLQLPPNNTYVVGMCGTGGPGWNNNDWGMTTALVL
jgi:hypothetical protein